MKTVSFLCLAVLLWAAVLQNLAAGELQPDESTILLLHFNNSLETALGESPSVATGIDFEDGLLEGGLRLHKSDSPLRGDSLYYALPASYDPAEGTVEFWISPHWIGQEYYVMQVFYLNNIRVQINIPGLMGLFMQIPENEQGYHDIQNWAAGQWHHVAATWKIPGRQLLYVDGAEITNNIADEKDLPAVNPDLIRIGAEYPSENVEAVIDEFRLSDRQRSAGEIAEGMMSAGFTIFDLASNIDSIRLQPGWDFTPRILATTGIGVSYIPNAAMAWNSQDPEIATVDEYGKIVGVSAGSTMITAVYESIVIGIDVAVDALPLEPETLAIDPFLATPAENCILELPIVIVEYIPMRDSTEVEWDIPWEHVYLDEVNPRLEVLNRRVKFMWEEGTRYHGYKDSTAIPFLGYRVVDHIRFYEHMPMSKRICGWNPANHYPDYFPVFERINAEHYVNDLGVKEFWIWYHGYHINDIGYELPESNMSSPVTGDISNSARDNTDLPVYEHSYILYQFDWSLTHNNAIHNQGHQIESMLGYVNYRQDGNEHLFFRKFCGMDSTDTWITGRCGWTHMPPNTDQHYIYDDTTHVWSDCEDWTPDQSGQQTWVNVDTWRNLQYAWPEEPAGWISESSPYNLNWGIGEANFYLYWRQNIPGYESNIAYGSDCVIANWWELYGDWDNAMRAGKGLYTVIPTTAIREAGPRSGSFVLRPNYPNPFNASTVIGYEVPAETELRLTIFNSLGQQVRELVHEHQPAGYHSLSWDGRDDAGLPVVSGVYFIFLDTRMGLRQQRMLYLK